MTGFVRKTCQALNLHSKRALLLSEQRFNQHMTLIRVPNRKRSSNKSQLQPSPSKCTTIMEKSIFCDFCLYLIWCYNVISTSTHLFKCAWIDKRDMLWGLCDFVVSGKWTQRIFMVVFSTVFIALVSGINFTTTWSALF